MPQDKEFESNLVDPSEDGGNMVDPSEDEGMASAAEQSQEGEIAEPPIMRDGDGPNF